MNKIRVIDLLNKIANGEEVPKKIRIEHWCYNFEWRDYASNYVDENENRDLMSALSCDKEELNYEDFAHKLRKAFESIAIWFEIKYLRRNGLAEGKSDAELKKKYNRTISN